MARRHTNFCQQIDDSTIDDEIQAAQYRMEEIHGQGFASAHELYAILKEELEEFWESVREHDPDPKEILDLIVAARSGLLWLCEQGRNEIQEMKGGDRP